MGGCLIGMWLSAGLAIGNPVVGDQSSPAVVNWPMERADPSAQIDIQFFYSRGLRIATSYYVRVTQTSQQATYKLITWSRYADVPLGSFPLAEATLRAGQLKPSAARELDQRLDRGSVWSLPSADTLEPDEFIAAETPFYRMRVWHSKRMEKPHFLQVITGSRAALKDRRYSDVLRAVEELVLSIDPKMKSYMPAQVGVAPVRASDVDRATASLTRAVVCLVVGMAALLFSVMAIRRSRRVGGRRGRVILMAALAGSSGLALLAAGSLLVYRVAHY